MADLARGYSRHFRALNPMDTADFAHALTFYDRLYGRFLPPDRHAKILDLGCGGGHFLHYVRSRGFANHLGIERDRSLVDFVRTHVTSNVEEQDLSAFLEAQEVGAWFVIALNDVIEHMVKPSALHLLERAREVLAADGRLFVKTINMSHPLGLRARYMDLTHEEGYTEESLRQLLTAAGLQPIALGPASPRWVNGVLRYGLYPLYRLHGKPVPRIVTADIVAIAGK